VASRPAVAGRADEIAKQCFALFARQGFDAVSMEDLSAATGLGKSSLYHHYAGKQDILAAGLDRALDALFAILDEPSAAAGTPLERVVFVLDRSLQTLFDLFDEVTVLVQLRGDTPVVQQALKRRRLFDRALADLITDAQSAGQVRADIDAALLGRLLLGMVNSTTNWFDRKGEISTGEAQRAIASTLHLALGTPEHI
jgi:AcrR family transcriptional regulator